MTSITPLTPTLAVMTSTPPLTPTLSPKGERGKG